jgi:hypothetical protein
VHKSGLLYHTEYKKPDRPAEMEREDKKEPDREKTMREGLSAERILEADKKLVQLWCHSQMKRAGDPVPNRDENRVKYSNPARVHAMLNKKPISTHNSFHQFGLNA